MEREGEKDPPALICVTLPLFLTEETIARFILPPLHDQAQWVLCACVYAEVDLFFKITHL